MEPKYTSINFHAGNILLLVAKMYSNVHRAILENIQNAIDANAKRVTLTVNYKTRDIYVWDDGEGVTRGFFEKCLSHVGFSVKLNSRADKFGRFGLGAMSPIGKCRGFTFTSTPRTNNGGYLRWTFDSKELESQGEDLRVPCESVPELRFGQRPQDVAWRTEVHWEKFDADRRMSAVTLDGLEGDILDRYGKTMMSGGVEVMITIVDAEGAYTHRKVVAKPYTGALISRHIIMNADAGSTHFEIYRARKTTKGMHGKIVIGQHSDPYRMSLGDFVKSPGVILDDTIVEAMTSGVFEGEIRTTKASLHESRVRFNDNDALLGLCETIEEWYQKYGAQHYEDATEGHTSRRHQAIGLKVLQEFERFLMSEDGSAFKDVLDSFKYGSTGGPTDDDEPTLQPEKSVQVKKGGQGSTDSNGGTGGLRPQDKPHLSIRGPEGRRRKIVKGRHTGLQLSVEPLRRSDKVWELDRKYGIILINSMHELFTACEYSEKALSLYYEQILSNVMTLQTLPSDTHTDCAIRQFEDALRPLVFLWINSPALTRGRGRPRQNDDQTKTLSRARVRSRARR